MGSQSSSLRNQAFRNAQQTGIPGLGGLPPKDFISEDPSSADHPFPVVSSTSRLSEICACPAESSCICPDPESCNCAHSLSKTDGKEVALQSIAGQDDFVPCVFTWSHGGHSVYLTGSFCGWSTDRKIRLNRSGHEFSYIQSLPKGRHYYKFIVDGQWRYAPDQQTQSDEHGNINNVLDISNFRHFQFKLMSEHEQAKNCVYHQCVPEPSEYTSDAPPIPLLLSKSTYLSADPPPSSDLPIHCLATHVYHDAQAPHIFGAHVSCISTTQRWRINNATPTSGQRYTTYIYLTVNPLYPYTPPGDGDVSGYHMPEPSTSIYYCNPLENILAPPFSKHKNPKE